MKHLCCYGGNGKTLLEDNPKARACPDCGRFTHPWEDIGDVKTRTIYHYNFTADGVPLISSKFRAMLDDFGVTNVEYLRLSSGYFAIRPSRQVFLDYSDCFVRIGEYCKTCCRPKHVLGHFWRAKLLQGEPACKSSTILPASLIEGPATGSCRTVMRSIVVLSSSPASPATLPSDRVAGGSLTWWRSSRGMSEGHSGQ